MERNLMSEQFAFDLVEATPDCVKVLDLDGRLQFINSQGRCLMEVDDVRTIQYKDWWDLWPEENKSKIRFSFEKVLHGEQIRLQAYCPTVKGTPKWWDIIVSPQKNADNSIRQIIVVSRDITELRSIDPELRESEERMRLVLSGTRTGIWTYNIVSGHVYWSSENYALYGVDSFDGTVESFQRFLHPDDIAMVWEKFTKTVETGCPYQSEFRIVRPDGSIRWISNVGHVQVGDDGKVFGVLGIARDITEQKEAEMQLQDSELRLQMAMIAGNAGTWDLDLVTGKNRWSESHFRYFGIEPTPDYVVSMDTWFNAIHPADISRIADEWNRAVAEQTDMLTDYRVIRQDDGRIVWCRGAGHFFYNKAGEAVRFTGVFFDVTAQKELEEKLRLQFEELENIYSYAPVGLAFVDLEFRFMRINSMLAEMNGISAEDHIGKSIYEIVPDIADEAKKIFDRVINSGEAVLNIEIKGETKAQPGVERAWNESWYPLKDKAGKIVGVSIMADEITERKKAQDSLRDSESKFRHLIESSIIGVLFWDVDGGIIDANDKLLEMLGYSREDLHAGIEWKEITPAKWAKADEKAVSQILATGHHKPYEKQYRHRDGSLIDVILGSSAFEGTGNRKGVSFVLDISERKRFEKELQSSEQRFQRLVRDATMGIVVLTGKEMKVEIVNEAFSKLIGATTSDLLHRNLFEVVPGIRQDHLPFIHKVIESGEDLQNFDAPYLIGLGDTAEERFLNVVYQPYRTKHDKIAGVTILCHDVTEQVISKRKLEESETRFRTLAQSVPQLVWIADSAGKSVWYNIRHTEYFGESYSGDSWGRYIHPHDAHRVKEAWDRAVQTGNPYEGEVRFMDKHSSYRWFVTNALPIRNNAGEVVNWFGICTDIHDQKMMTEKLEALVNDRTRQLQQSNEDLQQFAHVASHDLKEPIRKIKTFSNALQVDSVGLSDRQLGYLAKIQKASDRMADMIDGVLNYSSLGNADYEHQPVDLSHVFENVLADLEFVIESKNADVSFHGLPSVKGVEILFYQLFYNLVNNALKFTRPDRHPVIITSSSTPDRELVSKQNLPLGKSYVLIQMKDNGIGFDPKNASRIFVTFSRLHSKDKYEGTGLGLSLCKKIVERHGGAIWAEGKEGEGAIFFILLPA